MRKFSEGLLNDNLILQTLNISSGQAILDAGCGSGYMSKKFANLVGELGRAYACDVDRGQIEILQKEFKDTNIEVFVGDITKKTDFDDSSLDLIYLSTVFHIFSKDQVESFEKEVRRILKENGLLAIVNIDKKETPFGPPLEMRPSSQELREKISLIPEKFLYVGEYFYLQIFSNA